ncbi:Nn.00g003650.m01.CDS01 [Neocucurbitaria sp. VM-36]
MIVVVRVPYALTEASQTPLRHKDYRLPPSYLSAPYFQEQLRLSKPISNSSICFHMLNDTTVQHFDIYEAWLLSSELSTLSELEDQVQSSLAPTLGHGLGILKKKPLRTFTPEQARADYDNLLGCYSLGSTLGDRRFQDAVASKLIHLLRSPNSHQSQLVRLLTHQRIHGFLNGCTTCSPFFLLLATAYARFASVHDIQVLAVSNFPDTFKNGVMQALAPLRAKQHVYGNAAADFAVGECRFHTHGFYEACGMREK